jgi:vitamin B12 transporter
MKQPNILILLLLFSTALFAQETECEEEIKYDIVVSATLEETTTDKVGSSVTVITAEEIQRMQARTVVEVLKLIPGVQIVQNGGLGQTASVFIRGAKSEHTLLMIDGVEMNDVISPTRIYDFAHLTTDNVERIEILRGSQSILYGSDAIGGVINVITCEGTGKTAGSASLEGGAYGTYRGTARVGGGEENISYSAALSHVQNDGFSAADEELEGNSEEDGYENTSASAHLGIKPTEKTGLDFYLRYLDAGADVDSGGGAFNDDPNSLSDTQQLSVRGEGKALLLENRLELYAGVSYSSTEREAVNETDADHPFSSVDSEYSGDLVQVSARSTFHASDALTLTAGVETEEETGSSIYRSTSMFGPYEDVFEEQSVTTNSIFGLATLDRGDFNASAGLRYDDHDLFGEQTTWRVTGAWYLPGSGTILRASAGTGFKAPSLFQLYSDFGSELLHPEESTSWDVGVEQTFADGDVRLGATWFYSEFENMIDFSSFTFRYENIAEAESKGLELFAFAAVNEMVEVHANYTWTDAMDTVNDEKLLRRAEHQVNGRVNIAITPRAQLNLNGLYVGPRDDMTFVGFLSQRVELEEFFLVNLAASYEITEQFTLFGRLDNLFDEDYQWVYGYATAGLSGYAGLRIGF